MTVILIPKFSILKLPIEDGGKTLSSLKITLKIGLTTKTSLMNHTTNYFSSMFTTSHEKTDWSTIKKDNASFSNIDLSSLDKPLRNHEITKVVFSFKPYKAPVPDELHPFFFQKI